MTCSRHHFNLPRLDWTDRKTQFGGTRAYSPLICNLRRTAAVNIALSLDAVSIDVIPGEAALRVRLPKIAMYRSSDRLRAFRQLSVWFGIVSISFKIQNVESRRKEQHLQSTFLLQCVPQHASTQNLSFVFWK